MEARETYPDRDSDCLVIVQDGRVQRFKNIFGYSEFGTKVEIDRLQLGGFQVNVIYPGSVLCYTMTTYDFENLFARDFSEEQMQSLQILFNLTDTSEEAILDAISRYPQPQILYLE